MSRRTGRSRLAARSGAGALAAVLLLTGCAGDTAGELRREVAELTDDVNNDDPDGVSDSAESLIARTQDAIRNNDIDPAEGARIIELATLLRDRYAALQPTEPTPTPSPSPSPSPTEETETEEPETETETEEETEEQTPPPATSPPSPRPTQAPPSPSPEPSPPPETLLPEVPEG